MSVDLSPAAHAYLKAFDHWLHAVWKQPEHRVPENELATELKNTTLDHMLDNGGARHPICPGCNGPIIRRGGERGRPRKYCHGCRPSHRR